MNVTAINNLANLLENIPPKSEQGFNMERYWGTIDDETSVHVKHECGSTACIAGWAAQFLDEDGSIREEAPTCQRLLQLRHEEARAHPAERRTGCSSR